ncbi:unnamed protein product [Cochlearia groenlandica]
MNKSSCKSLRLSDLMEKWRKWKKGHFSVYTREGRRFVLPLDYLKHPIFKVLLEMAEEEFGSTICGPLQIPCDGCLMDHILMLLSKKALSGHGDDDDDDGDMMKNNHVVSSMTTSCKGASSVSYFSPIIRCDTSHDQNKLQSLVF